MSLVEAKLSDPPSCFDQCAQGSFLMYDLSVVLQAGRSCYTIEKLIQVSASTCFLHHVLFFQTIGYSDNISRLTVVEKLADDSEDHPVSLLVEVLWSQLF